MTIFLWIAAVYAGGFVATTLCVRSNGEDWKYSLSMGLIWPLYVLVAILDALDFMQ